MDDRILIRPYAPGDVDATIEIFLRAIREVASKDYSPAEIQAWDPHLVEAGEQVARQRAEYVNLLSDYVARAGSRLLDGDIELELRGGWSADQSLAEALSGAWLRDLERQQTTVGPHRAELVIRLEGSAARTRVSRGQQKLLASTLLLAQLQCDTDRGSKLAVLLVDDPAAELDTRHLQALLTEIGSMQSQLFVTALDPQNVLLEVLSQGRRFHVEHGKVARLV